MGATRGHRRSLQSPIDGLVLWGALLYHVMQHDFEGAYEITADTLRIYNSSGNVVSQAMIRSVRASMQLSLGRHEEGRLGDTGAQVRR